MGCVVSQSELILHKAEWKGNGKRIVFAGGAFDLLHPGHVRLLEQARALGDVLVVGVRSDAAVRAIHDREDEPKHQRRLRPITPAAERAEVLAALAAVDYAVIFDSPEPQELIAQLQPNLIVAGASDASVVPSPEKFTGTSPAKVFIPLELGYSTSSLIERIQQLRA